VALWLVKKAQGQIYLYHAIIYSELQSKYFNIIKRTENDNFSTREYVQTPFPVRL
jgi:hypothetical protein